LECFGVKFESSTELQQFFVIWDSRRFCVLWVHSDGEGLTGRFVIFEF